MVNSDPCMTGGEPSSSGPFWAGTGIFFVFCLVFVGFNFLMGAAGRCSKQAVSMGNVLIPIAVFCMWIMWAMVWLSQWHPLICPILSHEEQ